MNFFQASGEPGERPLKNLSGVDKFVIAFFFQLDIQWHGHVGGLHGAGYEGGMAQRVGAESDDRHVFFWIETERTQADARGQVAGGAEGANADSFPFERGGVGNFRARHKRVQDPGKIEGQVSTGKPMSAPRMIVPVL